MWDHVAFVRVGQDSSGRLSCFIKKTLRRTIRLGIGYQIWPSFIQQYIAEENRKKQELANCKLADFEIKSTLGMTYIVSY